MRNCLNYEYLLWKFVFKRFFSYTLRDLPKRSIYLIELIKKEIKDINSIAEIGVWRGHTAIGLLRHLPSIKVYYAIDPWTTYEDYKNSRDKKAYGDLALDEQICKNTLYFYKHKTVYHKMHSDKAANNINDLSLDFVFLDGNHSYQYVVEDIKLWKDKLRKGGIISGHDIDNPNFPDVRAAVEYIFGDSWIKGDDYLWWKKIE